MNFIRQFNLIDTDNSGEITKEELIAFMKSNNFNEDFADKWLTLFDLKQRGRITIDDFCERLGLEIDENIHKKVRKQRPSIINLDDLDDLDDFVDVDEKLEQRVIHVSTHKPLATPTDRTFNFKVFDNSVNEGNKKKKNQDSYDVSEDVEEIIVPKTVSYVYNSLPQVDEESSTRSKIDSKLTGFSENLAKFQLSIRNSFSLPRPKNSFSEKTPNVEDVHETDEKKHISPLELFASKFTFNRKFSKSSESSSAQKPNNKNADKSKSTVREQEKHQDTINKKSPLESRENPEFKVSTGNKIVNKPENIRGENNYELKSGMMVKNDVSMEKSSQIQRVKMNDNKYKNNSEQLFIMDSEANPMNTSQVSPRKITDSKQNVIPIASNLNDKLVDSDDILRNNKHNSNTASKWDAKTRNENKNIYQVVDVNKDEIKPGSNYRRKADIKNENWNLSEIKSKDLGKTIDYKVDISQHNKEVAETARKTDVTKPFPNLTESKECTVISAGAMQTSDLEYHEYPNKSDKGDKTSALKNRLFFESSQTEKNFEKEDSIFDNLKGLETKREPKRRQNLSDIQLQINKKFSDNQINEILSKKLKVKNDREKLSFEKSDDEVFEDDIDSSKINSHPSQETLVDNRKDDFKSLENNEYNRCSKSRPNENLTQNSVKMEFFDINKKDNKTKSEGNTSLNQKKTKDIINYDLSDVEDLEALNKGSLTEVQNVREKSEKQFLYDKQSQNESKNVDLNLSGNKTKNKTDKSKCIEIISSKKIISSNNNGENNRTDNLMDKSDDNLDPKTIDEIDSSQKISSNDNENKKKTFVEEKINDDILEEIIVKKSCEPLNQNLEHLEKLFDTTESSKDSNIMKSGDKYEISVDRQKRQNKIYQDIKIIYKDIDENILPDLLNGIVDIYEEKKFDKKLNFAEFIKSFLDKYYDQVWHALLTDENYEVFFSYAYMVAFRYDTLTFVVWKTFSD